MAAGTCVASVLGAEMTGEPAAMLPMGCVLAAIEVMPAEKKDRAVTCSEAFYSSLQCLLKPN